MNGRYLQRATDLLEITTVRSWWVVAFTLLAFAVYERASALTGSEIEKFSQQLENLEMHTATALKRQQKLCAQLTSQLDSSWIELTLIRELKMIPEGQEMVVFTSDNEV